MKTELESVREALRSARKLAYNASQMANGARPGTPAGRAIAARWGAANREVERLERREDELLGRRSS